MSGPALEVREPSAAYIVTGEPTLIRGFELTVTAAGGIATLRATILSLALRGTLVEQRADEESAATLLKAITAEKTRLALSGLVKPGRSGDAVSSASGELPKGWLMATLADLCVVVTDGDHLPPPKASRGVPFLVIGDVRAGHIDLSKAERFVPAGYFESLDWIRRPKAGDVLYTTVGSFGISISVLRDEEFCFQRHIALLRPGVPPLQPYLHLALKSPMVFAQAEHGATGIAQKTVSLAVLRSMSVPLPPLAEQHRIVARVEELMTLCDALEQSGRLADEQHVRLTSTLFDALAASESAHALAENWQRIAEHFDLLLDRPEAIDALEQTILQLAVRGLLVSGQSEPSHWKKTTAGAVLSFLNGYAFKSEWFQSKGVRLVRNVNVAHGTLNWTNGACVDDAVAQDMERFALQSGDLVISLDRPIISTGLKYAVVRECDLPCLLLQRVARMTPRAEVLDAAYFELWLQSLAFLGSIDPGRSNGVPHISTRQLEAIPFFLPPLAEQHRIVARVEELRRLCAQLRERVTGARRTQSQLADALVAEVA